MQDQSNAGQAETPDIEGQVAELFNAFESLPDDASNDALNATLLAQADLIRSIAKACEKTKLYARSKDQVDAFALETESAVEPAQRLVSAWLWFLDRVASAPTYFHTLGAVRLCMPIVARYLPAPVVAGETPQ